MAEQKIETGETRRVRSERKCYVVAGESSDDPDEFLTVEKYGESLATRRRTRESILLDPLVRNAEVTDVGRIDLHHLEPLQARTVVGVTEDGWVNMNPPSVVENPKTHLAQQGAGHAGWTCVGFLFAEMPETIHPRSQGWVDPNDPNPRFVNSIRHQVFTRRVVAKVAIWEKANG